MIIRSAWRGEGRKTSAPNRATSNLDTAIDIISIAQQARPKPSGQIELLRAQFTILSSCAKRMPSSSSSLPKSSGLVSVALLPSDVLTCASTIFSHSYGGNKTRNVSRVELRHGSHIQIDVASVGIKKLLSLLGDNPFNFHLRTSL